MSLIELQDICYAYEDVIALSHLDLQIEEQETLILKGPNGCGKSTLLQILNGLLFAQRGTYDCCGERIDQNTMKQANFAKRFHQRIGYLFQNAETQLFCNSVEDEIAFGPVQMGKSEAEVQQRVDNLIEMLGLEKLRQRAPYHLSGGEKKKVALAGILAVNPQVLILDEPISGLDQKAQEWMTDFLQQMKRSGKTIIMATHNEDFARTLGDREYVFHGA